MKAISLIFGLLLSLSVVAQFPSPSGLQFSYEYFPINGGGYCDGQPITGPAYCSHFNWNQPDFTGTEARFDHYRLYHKPYYAPDSAVSLIAMVPDTFFVVVQGFIGEMWVTAYYNEPEGESRPSDTVVNTDLPVGLPGNQAGPAPFMWYQANGQQIVLSGFTGLYSVTLYNLHGKSVLHDQSGNSRIQTGHLPSGLYVAKIQTIAGHVRKAKILIAP